jgi:hypothetical protein
LRGFCQDEDDQNDAAQRQAGHDYLDYRCFLTESLTLLFLHSL